jgi:hypothetical protein
MGHSIFFQLEGSVVMLQKLISDIYLNPR